MRWPHLISILAFGLSCAPAHAAPADTWSGAGPYACHGRCDQAWAETLLTSDELAQLRAVQDAQPYPEQIAIRDGAVFGLMTYYKEGAAKGYRTTTVATLDQTHSSEGWQMDGWAFVRIDACSNWAILRDETITVADAPILAPSPASNPIPTVLFGRSPFGNSPTIAQTIPIASDSPVTIPHTPIEKVATATDVAPVPLPAGFWFLLTGLGLLTGWRLWGKS